MIKKLIAICAVTIATVSVSHATMISAGSTVTATSLDYSGTTQAAVASTIQPGGTFTAFYDVTVKSDPNNVYCSGCLDFIYQIANVGTSGYVANLTGINYTGFLTDVGYNGSLLAPSTITRSADGSTILFSFATDNPLLPGQFSDFLVVQTNATQFASGLTLVSAQGGNAGSGPGYDPTGTPVSPVPEPSSLFLLGTGIIGVAKMAKMKYGR
jgi:hypothetical protein